MPFLDRTPAIVLPRPCSLSLETNVGARMNCLQDVPVVRSCNMLFWAGSYYVRLLHHDEGQQRKGGNEIPGGDAFIDDVHLRCHTGANLSVTALPT